MPTLTLKFKDNVISRFLIEKGDCLSIGRRKENDIVIENLAVSGHHAKVDSVGGTFVLVDLQSKNGSFVNEKLVTSHWLRDGDVISIGKHMLVFKAAAADPGAPHNPSAIDQTMVMDTNTYRSMVQKSAPVTPKPMLRREDAVGYLAYLRGGQGELKLTPNLIKIGKDPTCEVVVKGLFVGWTAATISRRPDGYHLSAIGGISKPRVNNQVVKKSVLLQDLDVVSVGSVKLQFLLRPPDDGQPA
jgi:pSer/pThr/pTyr-binding forkhead associated (FHA) protein